MKNKFKQFGIEIDIDQQHYLLISISNKHVDLFVLHDEVLRSKLFHDIFNSIYTKIDDKRIAAYVEINNEVIELHNNVGLLGIHEIIKNSVDQIKFISDFKIKLSDECIVRTAIIHNVLTYIIEHNNLVEVK